MQAFLKALEPFTTFIVLLDDSSEDATRLKVREVIRFPHQPSELRA